MGGGGAFDPQPLPLRGLFAVLFGMFFLALFFNSVGNENISQSSQPAIN